MMCKWISYLLLVAACTGCTDDGENKTSDVSRKTLIHTPSVTAQVHGNRQRDQAGRAAHAAELPGRQISKAKDASGNVRVTGKVKDSTGAPVDGAQVTMWTSVKDDPSTLTWRQVATVKSDPQGRYVIQGSGKDTTAITASKYGMAVAGADDLKKSTDLVGATSNEVDLQLLPEAPVSGRVLSAQGAPVAGAQVLACPVTGTVAAAIGEIITITDAAGTFKLHGASHGQLPIAVAVPGKSIQFFNAAAPAQSLDLKLSEKVPVLDGRLISDDTDLSGTTATIALEMYSPVGGLNINRKVTTGENASFQFGPVPSVNGMLFVQADPPGSLIPEGANYRSGRPYYGANLSDGVSTTVLIKVTSGKTLRGVALDVATSRPLAGVRLYPDKESLEAKRNFAETDVSGMFVLPHVYRLSSLQVRAEGYYMASPKADELQNRDTGESITLLMAQKPWVRGKVTGEFGAPVPGAKLSLYYLSPINSIPDILPLDTSGAYQVSLMPGKYRFFAEAPGCAPAFVDKDLEAADLNDVNLQLDKGRQLSGIVLSPEGKPVPGAEVLSQLCKNPSAIGLEPYYPYGNTTFGMPFGKFITDASGKFAFTKAPRDAGVAIIAKSDIYADSPVLFSDAKEGDVTDAKLTFPVTGELHGTVLDDTGKTISGANCEALYIRSAGHESSTAVSSTSGTFVLSKINTTAFFVLRVKADGHRDYQQSIGYTDSPLSVTLARIQEKILVVKCFDVETKKPVDAKVIINDHEGLSERPIVEAESKRPGEFRVAHVKAGVDYLVSATSANYMDSFKNQQLTDAPVEELELPMRRSGRITGRVVDENRKPVPSASIRSRFEPQKPIPLDADARFDFEIKQDYAHYYAEGPDGNQSDSFYPQVASGSSTDVGDIVLQGDKHITIRVLKGSDNRPASDVLVQVDAKPGTSGKTDPRGEFKCSINPGSSVSVTLPDWHISKSYYSSDKAIDFGQVIVLHVGAGVFRGRLLMNNNPVPGTITGENESVGSEQVSATALKDGHFEIDSLSPGNWTFSGMPASSNFASAKVSFSITGDEVMEKDIKVSDIPIKGTVVDSAGTPVYGATIRYTSSNGNGAQKSDADGNFSVQRIGTGNYAFDAQGPSGNRSDTMEVMIDNDRDQPPIRLVLKERSGRVVCTALSIMDGLPIRGAWAKVKSADSSSEFESSPQFGIEDAVIDNVPPGDYQLVVSATGYSQAQRNIKIEDGQTLEFTDVLSPAASLTAIVTDSNGYVAPNTQVTVTPLESTSVETPHIATTNPGGLIKIAGLLYGSYQVQATGPAGNASTTISTRNQRDVRISLMLNSK